MVLGFVRVPCLITGVVVALLFMVLMVTCRTIGLPLTSDTTFTGLHQAPPAVQR